MAISEQTLRDLEALIFASKGPATPAYLRKGLARMTPKAIEEAVSHINHELRESGRPYEIAQVAGGYQFRTRPEFGALLQKTQPERKVRLSRPALETVAVIAYKQPITRAEIEDLRCVDCGGVLKSLLERDLIRIVGRRDTPGRPALYGTSSFFLETFGLGSLRDLPALREIEALEELQGTPLETAMADGADDARDLDMSEDTDDDEDLEAEVERDEPGEAGEETLH